MIRLTQNGQDLASNAKTLVLLCRSGTGGNWKKLGEMTVSVFRQINPSKPPTLHKGPAEYHRTGEGLSAQVSPRPRVCPKTVRRPCSLRGHLLSAKTCDISQTQAYSHPRSRLPSVPIFPEQSQSTGRFGQSFCLRASVRLDWQEFVRLP